MYDTVTAVKLELDIDALVYRAAKTIVPVWPLESFIACNPLQGFEDMPFDEAFTKNFSCTRMPISEEKLEWINRLTIKWLAVFLDKGQASIAMPCREKGFYQSFCQLVIFDEQVHQKQQSIQRFLSTLPDKPQQTIVMCLKKMNIELDQYETVIEQLFLTLPGWAGYIKYLSQWCPTKDQSSIDLLEYMAVRLILTSIGYPDFHESQTFIYHEGCLEKLTTIKQTEQQYVANLLPEIERSLKNISVSPANPDVQMVFCIDVRSEPFRKNLEALGDYETLGFAGFFGLPVRIYDEKSQHFQDCCPVLLQPQFNIYPKILASEEQKKLVSKRQDVLNSFVEAYHQLKYNFTTPFNLADAMGPWCGLGMLFKNFFPKFLNDFLTFLKRCWIPSLDKTLEIQAHDPTRGIPSDVQITYADKILRLMGLTQNFAKLIVFCGHHSHTTNNPYASALQCGACGGHAGGDNAMILANILNQPSVREGLKLRGIMIPEDSFFLSATQDTTTQECKVHSTDLNQHHGLMTQFKKDLKTVQQKIIQQTHQYFDDDQPILRNLNWSEVRPEWGLARNAALIVGPRSLTRDIQLDGRVFLHSYQWEIDEEGQLLETILTAPMVVAQWINHQYLFSTLDNVKYGSGSKVTQNVVGQLGIMQGNASDLMHGLALQSVYLNHQEAFHLPQRLLTIVYAPRDVVEVIISKHEILQNLFFNQWVQLLVIEPGTHNFYYLKSNEQWEKLR